MGFDGLEEHSTTLSPKSYAPPRLIRLGCVKQFTQSASSGATENSSGNPPPYKPGSDPRVKERIQRVGTHPLGVGLYLFDYRPAFRARWGQGRQFGVMADEVMQVLPEAVSRDEDGFLVVDYGRLGLHRPSH